MKRKALFIGLALLACLPVSAQNFMAVGKPSKVFDTPDATKGYVTMNQNNDEVHIVPGMVFRLHETKNGWSLVEYSPGLRGYVSEQVQAADKMVAPKTGAYSVANNPKEKVRVTNAGDLWTLSSSDKTYSGRAFGKMVVFFEEKKACYSLIDLGEGGLVINYDNSVTNFF